MNRISIKDIADNNTSISSTRWAFATVVRFDIIMIVATFISYVVCNIVGKPLDVSFIYAIGVLLGVLTTLIGGTKVMQGFEPKKDKPISENTYTNEDDGK